MPSARFWKGSRLVAGWIVSVALFVLIRWGLERGVVRAAVRDDGVERLGGIWSPTFATLMTFVAAGVLAAVLSWLTASWLAGRRERAALRRYGAPAHRRILM